MMKYAVLAGLVCVGLSMAACSSGPYTLTSTEHQTSELGARQYSQSLGMDFVSCSGQDSDRDGYVTCTVKQGSTPQAALCSYKDNGVGCKPK